MRKLFFLFATLLCLASCSDEIVTGGDTTLKEPEQGFTEPTMKTIRISASSGESDTRTTMDGQSVLWDNNDEFLVVKEGSLTIPSTMLRITMDSNGSGIGYKTTEGLAGLSSEINVKYGDVNVKIGNEDVTDKILSSDTKSNNPYKVGITNSDGHYQFVAPNTEMWAKLYGSGTNKTFLLSRSTSTDGMLSESNPAVVTLTDIQYKLRLEFSWHSPLNENSTLTNGANIDGVNLSNVKKYEWLHGINSSLKLASEPGLNYGDFSGQVPTNTAIDDETCALYPKSAFNKLTNGTMVLTLPATQTYAENSFDHNANIMIGQLVETEEDTYHVPFKNMCGVLQLKLKGEGELGTISVTDKGGKMLWGTASLAIGSFANGINTDMISGGSSTITLNCDGVSLSDEETVFNIVVPEGAFENGMDIEVKSKGGQMYRKSTSANNRITRNIVKQMPALSVEMIDAYDLENDAVKLFFSYPRYQTYGEASHFTTYASVFKNLYSHDTPNKVPLSWTGDASTTYTITLTYKNDDGVNTTKTYTATGSSYDLDNLVPGKKYTYTITTGVGNGTTVKTGSFYTSGQVRMGRIDDSWNCRDLGGWTGLNGKKIKYEWIYRCSSLNGEFYKKPSSTNYVISECANPNNYTFHEASRQQVLDLGFKSELDLRTTEAEENNSSAKGLSHSWSLDRNNTGIDDWHFFHIKTSGATAALTNYSVVKDVAWIINEVINEKRPVAFHCRSGADRTGMVAIAIESLLGVAPGDLARDYELTNFSSEQPKAEGKNELRDRRADGKASNKESYTFHNTIFKEDTSNPGTNYQEKMYYYLNQKFANIGVAISASDLDNFIKFMLGLDSYTHPSWASENGNSLESIFNHQ